MLVLDEYGDRKWGRRTAHVGRQYLANLGETDSRIVSVTSAWMDGRVYWPQHHFAEGKADPDFRTRLVIAGELVTVAVADGLPFRAVVAVGTWQPQPDDSRLSPHCPAATCHRWRARDLSGREKQEV